MNNNKKGCVVKGYVVMISTLIGAIASAIGMGKLMNKKVTEKVKLSDKHLTLFLMMNQWVRIKQEGKSIAGYFEENGYHSIAVYGMSYVGETFIKEMEASNIEILYGIDKNVSNILSEITVASVDDELEEVDAIVVTAITFFDEIEQILSKRVKCPIISLEDIIYTV